MSGILGILNRDGAPADRDLLGEMTRFMAYRGPDGQQVWREGAVGLGHALLRTTRESDQEQQPCTLDGQVWITADARVDARAELMGKLESAGRREVRQATDAELILHAYQVWGEESPEHLLGDFAFLIWDGRRRVLFGARDQFGVKPFYYAEAGHSLLCSNTLDCLRLHPGVSDELNDLAIADFLLFGINQDLGTTCFTDIRRLPPGHCMVCTEEALRIRRYWTLPFEEIRYKRASEYVERFNELLGAAVKDRIRTDRVAVYMSGGLDSTLVAAVANRIMGKSTDLSGVRACTIVYDRIIRDQERKYAQLAADFLQIPIQYVVADDYSPYADDCCWQFSKPEPRTRPQPAIEAEPYRLLAGYTRVALSGLGGDSALCANDRYIADYLRVGALGELMAGIGWCFWYGRRVPRLGFRSLLKEKTGKGQTPLRAPYPRLLNRDLDQRLELSGRWDRLRNQPSPVVHRRSKAYQDLQSPTGPANFEALDPGVTRFPIEQRHPYFDLRVATFLAGLPTLPWCQEKTILKAAGRGILPNSVRLRPKEPLGGDPILEHLRRAGPEWWAKHLDPVPELLRYANPDTLPRATAGERYERWMGLGLVSLNYWLQLGRKPRKMVG